MEAKTVQLAYPITVNGKTMSEVVFRRPKGRDMRLLARVEGIDSAAPVTMVDGEEVKEVRGEAAAEASALLIRAVTGLSEAAMDELDLLEDIPKLSEEAANFLESITPPAQASGAA